MSASEERSEMDSTPRLRRYRRLAWALLLLWTCGWGIVGVGPWIGIPDLPQDSPVIRLIPVGIGIIGGIATRRHPLAGGVYWLITGFLLSSLIVVRMQSVADMLIWCFAAFPALVTGILSIVNLTPAERAAVPSGTKSKAATGSKAATRSNSAMKSKSAKGSQGRKG